ncbi:MAG: hypothetical protein OXF20_10550 [Gammaproteobacteria bacterium]|nr:hypothetical protein [Gammaproteobacteria bacterium]
MMRGLSPLELGRLRISVGYGTNKKGRPLSPIEVGLYLRRALDAGETLRDCSRAIQLNGTGHIGRFLRILALPSDLQHLINWGSGRDFISFSSAVELVNLETADDQRAVAESIMETHLNKTEVRQIVQLRNRAGHPISDCISEILGMRTIIEKRYVFIGSIKDKNVQDFLIKLTQMERDSILDSSLQRLGFSEVSGRLGKQFFTLVGREHFNESMRCVGKQNIEQRLRSHISKEIENVSPDS